METPLPSFDRNESIRNGTIYTKEIPFVEVFKRPRVLIICLLLLILILSSVFGNLVVCYTILATRRLRFAAYYFVASLAAADFGVGVFVMPVSLAYNLTFEMKGKWIFGEAACDIWILANFWFCSASIFNLCAVTWDRYVAVTSPLRYQVHMSDQRVFGMLVASWTISLAASLINFYGLKTSESRTLCEINGIPLSFVIYSFVCVYAVPVFAIIFVNAKLWVITTRQTNRIQTQFLSPVSISMATTKTTETIAQRRQLTRGTLILKSTVKTFRTFLVLIGLIVCSMTPFFVVLLINSVIRFPGFVLYLVVIITYINSATNPWVYGIWNKEFRGFVRSTFRRLTNAIHQS